MGASVKKDYSVSKKSYVRTYKDIKGVDFSDPTGAIGAGRAPYIENMYRDYMGGNSSLVESVPGFRSLFSLGSRINSMLLQRLPSGEEYVILHAGSAIYRFNVGERDSGVAPKRLATVANGRSTGVLRGSDLYLFDGSTVTRITASGEAQRVSDIDPSKPYVPIRFKNGVETEQHNLLSDKFAEIITLSDYSQFNYGSDGLTYAVNDDGESCSVVKGETPLSGIVYIPSRVTVGERSLEVTEIGDLAFSGNTQLIGIVTADGLRRIGEGAFLGCTALSLAVVSDTVTELGEEAFADCKVLQDCFIGIGLEVIGKDAFNGCTALKSVKYAGAESAFLKIDGADGVSFDRLCGERYRAITLTLPVRAEATAIESVTLDGTELYFTEKHLDGRVVSVDVDIGDKYKALGKDVTIKGVEDATAITDAYGKDVRDGEDPALFRGGRAIKRCTRAAIFDGRIFLTGNPDLPNVVFFSSDKRPMYFGSLDYIRDGVGGYPVRALLPANDSLIVMKSGDDGNGSIFYHKRQRETSMLRSVSYPATFANSGIPVLGDGAVFYDDPVFISRLGLCGLERSELGGVRAVLRSSRVNPRLLAEDANAVRMANWQGYLVLSVGGRMYLADSRRTFISGGEREYEWFYLTGIGVPKKKNYVYKLHSCPYGELKKHENEDAPVDESLITSEAAPPSSPVSVIYKATIDGVGYHAYRSGELKDEGIYPCCEVLTVGELLFLGCEDGTVAVFNNDKRGKPSKRLMDNDTELTEEGYAAIGRRDIHPDYYTFDGYKPTYAISTGKDECELPYAEKNTVPASVTAKLKGRLGGRVRIDLRTEPSADSSATVSIGGISFDSLRFDSLSFGDGTESAIFYPSPKRWVEKEISLSSCEPFGVSSVSYRFRVNGRIKKR